MNQLSCHPNASSESDELASKSVKMVIDVSWEASSDDDTDDSILRAYGMLLAEDPPEAPGSVLDKRVPEEHKEDL